MKYTEEKPARKTKRTKKSNLKSFTVINDADPNTTFEVMAKDVNEAQYLALIELGWFVAQ